MTKQYINKWQIYKHNLWATFVAPKEIMSKPGADEGAAAVAIAAVIVSPLTLTLGVGIKTIADITSRHVFSEADINNIKSTITNLDNEQFESFIMKVLSHDVSSYESNDLKLTLENANTENLRKIFAFTSNEQERIKQEKIQQLIEKSGIPGISRNDIQINNSYKFSEIENKEYQDNLNKAVRSFRDANRAIQTEAIFSYIDNNLNAGKKLQHIIKDEAEIAKSSIGLKK